MFDEMHLIPKEGPGPPLPGPLSVHSSFPQVPGK